MISLLSGSESETEVKAQAPAAEAGEIEGQRWGRNRGLRLLRKHLSPNPQEKSTNKGQKRGLRRVRFERIEEAQKVIFKIFMDY